MIKNSEIFVCMLACMLVCMFCLRELACHSALHVQPITENVLSLLDDTLEIDIQKNDSLPADISFLFADLKYNDQNNDDEKIKICEFGGIMAGMANTQVMINSIEETLITPYWNLFWHYAKKYNKPLWYIGENTPAITKELFAVGGKYFANLSSFTKYLDTTITYDKKSCDKKSHRSPKNSKNIKDCAGILILANNTSVKTRQKFMQTYPDVLVANRYVRRFTLKQKAYKLFHEDAELRPYMPRLKSYNKKYTSNLAQQICTDIPTDYFVIKPIDAMQSKGVVMTDKAGLDGVLKLILRDTITILPTAHKSLSHWKKDANMTFFVEEYAPSKTIIINKKTYDPTMRLVFFMSHEAGKIKINVVAGYWKIPVKALSEEGTLTEKHITKPFSGDFFTGIMISPDDMKNVKNIFKSMPSNKYVKMLAAH